MRELLQKQQQLEQGKTELDAKRKQLDNENAAIRAMLSTVLLEKKLLLEKETLDAEEIKQVTGLANVPPAVGGGGSAAGDQPDLWGGKAAA